MRLATSVTSLLMLMLAPGSALAQQSRVIVGASVPISVDDSKRPHFETFLAVDPHDPKHMLVSSMVLRGVRFGTSIYVSFDGGRRWARARMASKDTTLFTGGDGAVYFDRDGTALTTVGALIGGRDKTLVSRSTDGGLTWTSPVVLPYRDRPWVAFDASGGALDGAIYVAGLNRQGLRSGVSGFAFVLSRSRDGGRTYNAGDVLMHDDGGPDREAPLQGILTDMLVSSDGVILMPYQASLESPGRSPPELAKDTLVTNMLRVLVSDDGGRTFATTRNGPSMRWVRGYRGRRASAAPRAAIDQSRGPNRGRLYVVWSDYDESRYQIKLARSQDLGHTWATTLVSDDTTGHDQGNPAVAVNGDGIVAVVWNDRRDDPKGECWTLYGAISLDAGDHFLPGARLSEALTCPNAPLNWTLSAWDAFDTWTDPAHPVPGIEIAALVPVRFPNGGDTQGLVADGNGDFHAAYIDGVSGVMQLWLKTFRVDPALMRELGAARANQVSAAGLPRPVGREDLTLDLRLEVSQPRIDFATHSLAVSVRVVNPTSRAVRGPIDVVVDQLLNALNRGMGLKNLRVANADTGGPGPGATWTFRTGRPDVLPPHGRTRRRLLLFAFDGGIPAQPDGFFEPRFRIYAPTR